MKIWALIGMLAVLSAPSAYATPGDVAACTVQSETRAGAAPVAQDVPRATKSSLLTPAVVAERERLRARTRKHPRTIEAGLPDSVLIGGTGAL